MLLEPIAHTAIIEAGITHILVLSTKPLGYNGKRRRSAERLLIRHVKKYGQELQPPVKARCGTISRTAAELHKQTTEPDEPPYTLTLAPAGSGEPVGILSRKKASIEHAGLLGTNAVLKQLGKPVESSYHLPEAIRFPFQH